MLYLSIHLDGLPRQGKLTWGSFGLILQKGLHAERQYRMQQHPLRKLPANQRQQAGKDGGSNKPWPLLLPNPPLLMQLRLEVQATGSRPNLAINTNLQTSETVIRVSSKVDVCLLSMGKQLQDSKDCLAE